MRKSPDSLSKAILGERHGYQEYDQYPDIGEAVINDLSKSQLAAFYGLKHHMARKLLFLRLGIGSKLPLSIHRAAVLLGMTVNDARTLEDDTLIELADVLDPSDIAWLDKALIPSSPEEIQAEIEQEEKLSGRYESDDHDLDDDEEEDKTPGPEAKMIGLTMTQNLQADSLDDPLHPIAVAIQSLLPRESKVMRLLLGVGTNVPTSILDAQEVLSMTRGEIGELAASAMGKLKAELSPDDRSLVKKKLSPKDYQAIRDRMKTEAKMTNPTTDNAQPAATPEPDKIMSLEEIQVAMTQPPAPPVAQDEACEPTTPVQAVQPVVESPAPPAPAKPEAPASPSNEARIQELERSMTDLQKSVRRLTDKNRDLLTRVEVLEHEGEEQDQKIREFLGELDRREVIRMNTFTKAVDGMRAEVAQLALTKLPTDPPPPAKSAEVIPIRGANQHKAGPDGFFQAEGSSWGLINSLARRLGIDEPALRSRLSSGKVRSRQGLDCHGTANTFYEWSDALRVCADLVTLVPQDRYGLVKIKGRLYASQIQLAKILHLYPKALLQHIDASVRSCLGKCRSGVIIFYCVVDAQRVCPRNSTPHKAQRAK